MAELLTIKGMVMKTFKEYLIECSEEETEAKIPATADKLQMALGRAKETTREMQPSAKRWKQRQTRRRRQTTGK